MQQNLTEPSGVATLQNISELSNGTLNNPQSFTIPNDSIVLQIPVHNVTHNRDTDPKQNNTNNNPNQNNTSTLSTTNTDITHIFRHNNHHLEIVIHFLFHYNMLLILFLDSLVSIIHFVQFVHFFAHISNKFLLILCTVHVILLQITFIYIK